MDQKKRSTLLTLGAIGLGYAGFRYVPSLIPQRLELEAMSSPEGFRKFSAGETSSGGFDMFVGLTSGDDVAQRDAKQAADARIRQNVCGSLYANLDLAADQIPMASFSDYYCPFCRVQTKRLGELVKAKGSEVAVAWHELPLLGENSYEAAKAALAAKRQGSYVEFHDRLMRTPFVADPAYLVRLSADLGVDHDRLVADMESDDVRLELENSAALSRAFAFIGTPALVIGRTVVSGQISDRLINDIIDLERTEGWREQCGYV